MYKQSRLFYLLAIILCASLFFKNTIIVFLAACFSCLTLPLYRNLKRISAIKMRKNKSSNRLYAWFLRNFPIYSYIITIISYIVIPISILIILVAPQAKAGLNKLKEMQANHFALPQNWVDLFDKVKAKIAEYPIIDKTVHDLIDKVNEFFGDAVTILVTQSFKFLGGTFTAIWTIFLIITLTVLFTVYAREIRTIFRRLFQIDIMQLCRITRAVQRALRGIIMGIVFVAIIQGCLCGVAFAVAGIPQAAFWGLLATFMAPIPGIGTALIWGPLSFSLWFTGHTVAAIGLALWGIIVVAGIDNILRPLFLRQGISAPLFVLILSILCGMVTFGSVGLIVGPIIIAMALQFIKEADANYMQGAQVASKN
ncbi:MAG: AI-2E family transporter [Desulfovibrionaceae bacterium]|nr:AI-2E family transporter [Desulfovibrionaceae bacterium]